MANKRKHVAPVPIPWLTSWRGVDGHVVRGVVQELGARVALNVVAVVVAPAQLQGRRGGGCVGGWLSGAGEWERNRLQG